MDAILNLITKFLLILLLVTQILLIIYMFFINYKRRQEHKIFWEHMNQEIEKSNQEFTRRLEDIDKMTHDNSKGDFKNEPQIENKE